jgi:hypothetical protein
LPDAPKDLIVGHEGAIEYDLVEVVFSVQQQNGVNLHALSG